MVQCGSAFYLTFIGFTKSPTWAGLWYIRIAPVIHLIVTVGALLVIPILVCINTCMMAKEIH